MIPTYYKFPQESLHQFAVEVFQYYGIAESDARLAADVLAYSDIHGIDSHGVARMYSYVSLLEAGRINPKPNIRIVRERKATATVDGDNGLGLVVGPRAMAIAMEKAKDSGASSVAVRNTNHYGAAGYYPVEALKHDLIGYSMTNTTKGVAPFRGAEKMLGTNPIAIAFPGMKEPPIVIDMATSVVAYGKLEIANRQGREIPDGWAIASNGWSTRKPQEMMEGGALLPLGSNEDGSGHKGYCLMAMVDILTGVLSGANWGPFVPPFAINAPTSDEKVGKGIGHFFGAWDIDAFRDVDEFKRQIDHWIHTMRSTRPQPGQQAVLIPGDPEREARIQRKETGIPLIEAVVKDLEAIGKKTGVKLIAT